jgi:hypothetical protein
MTVAIKEGTMSERAITDWAIRADPYSPPECRRLWITGITPDTGKTIRTNYVLKKFGPLTYETASGSHYRLEGPPDPEYAAFCKENGIALDCADPIKFRATVDEFEFKKAIVP